jgi:DNA-binding response OmpR family regulator
MITALVIDDTRLMADILCQLLNLFEIDAQPAYGSRAAMLALRDTIPDIIFVDINMPGVSGIEVISYLRREQHLEDVPVIVVTSDDSKETNDKALQVGALDVIIKPVSLDILDKVLKKAHIIT